MGIQTTMKKFNDPTDGFIKAYRSLRNLPLNLNQICFLEYVSSFTSNGLEFRDHDNNIGHYLKMTAKSTNNLINNLANQGYIKTSRQSHAGQSGWTRYIVLNENFIQSQMNNENHLEVQTVTNLSQNEVVTAKVESIAETAPNEALQPSKTIITTEPIVFGNYEEKDTMTDEKIAEIFGESAPAATPEQPENGLTIEQMISTIRNSPELSNLGRTILTEYSNWDRNRLLGFYDIWSNNAAEKLLASKPQVYAEAG